MVAILLKKEVLDVTLTLSVILDSNNVATGYTITGVNTKTGNIYMNISETDLTVAIAEFYKWS